MAGSGTRPRNKCGVLRIPLFPVLRRGRFGILRAAIGHRQERRERIGIFRDSFLALRSFVLLLAGLSAFLRLVLMARLLIAFFDHHAVAMIGMLKIIFGEHPVAGGQRVAGLGQVFFAHGAVVFARAVATMAAVMAVALLA